MKNNKFKNSIIAVLLLIAIISGVIAIISNALADGEEENSVTVPMVTEPYVPYRNNVLGVAGDFCVFCYSDAKVSQVTADVAIGGDFEGQNIANYDTNWDFYKDNDLRFVNLNSYIRGHYNECTYAWKANYSKDILTSSTGVVKGTYDVNNTNGRANLVIYTGEGSSNVLKNDGNMNQININGHDYENTVINEGDLKYRSYIMKGADFEYIDFDEAFNYLSNASERLMQLENIEELAFRSPDGKTFSYEVPQDKDVIIVKANAENYFDMTTSDTFDIVGLRRDQKIIINIDCTEIVKNIPDGDGADRPKTPMTKINGSAEDWQAISENIIFNYYLPSFVDKTIEVDQAIGCILAPNVNVYIDGNLDGQVIARKLTANNAIYGINSNIGWADVEKDEKINISVTKVWDDQENEEQTRPAEITVSLLANGEVYKTQKLSNSNNWSYTFEKCDKKKDGEDIEYTVQEETIEGYEVNVSGNINVGFTITNKKNKPDPDPSPNPKTIDLSVKKEWNDENNKDGNRPARVEVKLFADGVEIKKQALTEPTWSYTFKGLRKESNGREIKYTIKEESVGGYSSKITGNMQNGYIITNTPIKDEEVVNINVGKTWDDFNNKYNTRPEKINVRLFANDEEINSEILSQENEWKCSFNNLPKLDNSSKEIKYSIKEDTIFGYGTSITGNQNEGFTILNTLNSVNGTISINKYEQNSEKLLENAKIKIEISDKEGNAKYTIEKITDKDGKITMNNIDFKIGEQYTIKIYETEAPEGYTKTKEDITIKINTKKDNDKVSIEAEEDNKNVLIDGLSISIKVENPKKGSQPEEPEEEKKPSIIPQTGSAETIITTGVAIIILGIVEFAYFRYKKNEKK